MTRIIYIDNVETFHQHFSALRESARGNTTPDHFLVGFDTEYVEGNPKKVCVIQVGTAEIVLVIHVAQFQTSHLQHFPEEGIFKKILPKQLLQLIRSPSWIKVGVGVGLDLHYVALQYHLGHCSGGIDLKNLAHVMHLPQTSLVGLYNRFIKPTPLKSEKKQKGVYNWALPTLPKEKIEYAGMDAYMAYVIFKAMIQSLFVSTVRKRTDSSSIDLLQDDDDDYEREKDMEETTQVQNPKPTTELLLDLSPPSLMDVTDTSVVSLPQSLPPVVVTQPTMPVANYVGRLNEYAQQRRVSPPKYTFGSTFTGEHTCACYFGRHTTQSIARSKKLAKQQASQFMLNKVGTLDVGSTRRPNTQSAMQRLSAYAQRYSLAAPLYAIEYKTQQNTFNAYKVVCGFANRHVFGIGGTEAAGKEAAAKEMLMALLQGR